jgi:hypothetical protein
MVKTSSICSVSGEIVTTAPGCVSSPGPFTSGMLT